MIGRRRPGTRGTSRIAQRGNSARIESDCVMRTDPIPRQRLPEASRILFRSELLVVGRVEMEPDHPQFRDGPVPGDMLVFPEYPMQLTRSRDVTRTVDATMMVTYFEGQEFRRTACTPRGTRGNWVAPRPALARLLHEIVGEHTRHHAGTRFPTTAVPISRELHRRAAELHRVVERPHADPLAIEEYTLDLIDCGIRAVESAPNDVRALSVARRELADSARMALARDLAAPLSLGFLADSLQVSPAHLCRVFKVVTGQSLRQYRRELRLRRALLLLRDSDTDLTAVALLLGFASHSHFTAWFRQSYGSTPSRYRHSLARRSSRD